MKKTCSQEHAHDLLIIQNHAARLRREMLIGSLADWLCSIHKDCSSHSAKLLSTQAVDLPRKTEPPTEQCRVLFVVGSCHNTHETLECEATRPAWQPAWQLTMHCCIMAVRKICFDLCQEEQLHTKAVNFRCTLTIQTKARNLRVNLPVNSKPQRLILCGRLQKKYPIFFCLRGCARLVSTYCSGPLQS